jgi:hypothetical protein
MEVSRNEAQESLSQIEEMATRTRRLVACGGGDVLFMMWGVIWVLGFLGNQFVPRISGPVWLGLVGAGVLVTWIVAKRAAPVRSPVDRRIGWFWLLLYAYVYLWFAFLSPFIKVQSHAEMAVFYKHFGAIAATIPMFAYVVTGLWLDNFMIWLGLAVTALTVAGLYLLTPHFYFWMAAVGGGTLIGTGLVIRNRWK